MNLSHVKVLVRLRSWSILSVLFAASTSPVWFLCYGSHFLTLASFIPPYMCHCVCSSVYLSLFSASVCMPYSLYLCLLQSLYLCPSHCLCLTIRLTVCLTALRYVPLLRLGNTVRLSVCVSVWSLVFIAQYESSGELDASGCLLVPCDTAAAAAAMATAPEDLSLVRRRKRSFEATDLCVYTKQLRTAAVVIDTNELRMTVVDTWTASDCWCGHRYLAATQSSFTVKDNDFFLDEGYLKHV